MDPGIFKAHAMLPFLLAVSCLLAAGAVTVPVRSNSTALYTAFANPNVTEIVIRDNIDMSAWVSMPALDIGRSVLLRSSDELWLKHTYPSVAWAGAVGKLRLLGNSTLQIRGLVIETFSLPAYASLLPSPEGSRAYVALQVRVTAQ